jgi:transcriptional regulator with XRE-family HTH domain
LAEFDIAAFHEALDAARQQRGLTWTALARELNASFAHRRDIPPISAGTLSGMAKRSGLNGNIVMTALRWLGRSPESFVSGQAGAAAEVPIPDAGPGHLLRWDGPALYAAVDARRQELGLSWAELAERIGAVPAQLKWLARNYGAGFPWVMRVTTWLEQPAAEFMIDVPV